MILRGCDPSDTELVNTEIRLQISYMMQDTFKIYSSLPWDIKTCIDNPRTFKKAVKKFLYTKFFYSLNEFYGNNKYTIHCVPTYIHLQYNIEYGHIPGQVKIRYYQTNLKKKRNAHDITNYRPISLLTSFSKVIEKILYIIDLLII